MTLPPVRITTSLDHEPLRALYGESEPFSWAGPGDEPQLGVSAFPNADGPHWHYVTLGTRALFGFELTFRLEAASVSDATSAPRWPVELLQRLARHTLRCRRLPALGWYVCFERPLDPAGGVRCVAVVDDPQLPEARQAVGLHADEVALMSEDSYPRFLRRLRDALPLLVTRPTRDPVTLD